MAEKNTLKATHVVLRAMLPTEHHPQICGVNLCTGLRHAEEFGNVDEEGSDFAYRCGKCGETETVSGV
jgi:hypothetical protein